MNVRLRNRVRISGRPGAPVVVLAHGSGAIRTCGGARKPKRKSGSSQLDFASRPFRILTRLIKAKSEKETVHLPGERRLHLG